jgi:hypothetical protein
MALLLCYNPIGNEFVEDNSNKGRVFMNKRVNYPWFYARYIV